MSGKCLPQDSSVKKAAAKDLKWQGITVPEAMRAAGFSHAQRINPTFKIKVPCLMKMLENNIKWSNTTPSTIDIKKSCIAISSITSTPSINVPNCSHDANIVSNSSAPLKSQANPQNLNSNTANLVQQENWRSKKKKHTKNKKATIIYVQEKIKKGGLQQKSEWLCSKETGVLFSPKQSSTMLMSLVGIVVCCRSKMHSNNFNDMWHFVTCCQHDGCDITSTSFFVASQHVTKTEDRLCHLVVL